MPVTSSAWHHGRTARRWSSLDELLRDACEFARGPYAHALSRGGALSDTDVIRIAEELASLTGIAADWWCRSNLRATIPVFQRELLRDSRVSIGASDTRYVVEEADGVGERPTLDGWECAVGACYQSAFAEYLCRELRYDRSEMRYVAADNERIMGAWDWAHSPPVGSRQNALASTVGDMSHAMRALPALEILVLCGRFDLMTPFFGMEYDLNKIGPSVSARNRITLRHYEGGHMLYADDAVLPVLARDVGGFIGRLLQQ